MAVTKNDKWFSELKRKVEGSLRNIEDGIVTSHGSATEFCFGDSFALTAAYVDNSGDPQLLAKFPSGAYITDLRSTPSDMDTNATPTLVYDIVSCEDDGTVKDTLVSGSTNGQAAAGSDRIANAAVGQFVGDRNLAIKVTTGAATAAAGTIKVFYKVAIGILNYDASRKPRMTDAAI